MSTRLQEIDARIESALAPEASRIPVVLGPDRSGRTSVLRRIADAVDPSARLYVDLERMTSTPERFLASLGTGSAFVSPPGLLEAAGPAAAFSAALDFMNRARTRQGRPVTFLLDEWLELRTFEHFPGLKRAVDDTIASMAASENRFVLTSRFVARALRALQDAPDRLMVLSMPALTAADVAEDLSRVSGCRPDTADEFAQMIVALTGGIAGDARALVDALAASPSLGDPISALVACLAPGATLDGRCRYSYEYRLHRARGYGALKGVLGILAGEEPLTLTEISVRLKRTPGSTRDYLWWLEDVDLVVAHRKQYAFADPMLRLWVGLFDRLAPAGDEARATAVQRYALARLSQLPPAASN